MKKILIFLFANFMFSTMISCKQQSENLKEETPVVAVKTATITQGDIHNMLSFNGKTVYLKKNTIISPISGYIVKLNVSYGDMVQKNDLLFEIQTKEKKALGSADSLLSKVGVIKIMAPSNGVVSELSINQSGVYVAEGIPLCTISENRDLMFQLNIPFEYNQLMKIGSGCRVLLSDQTFVEGTVFKIMPEVNTVSQTQNVLIRPLTSRMLPENLNVSINIKGSVHRNCLLVTKKAVLTNEVQSEFWVMKVVNNTAIKVPVVKGFENDSLMEITSPSLKLGDAIIVEGAYGLADSTIVKTQK